MDLFAAIRMGAAGDQASLNPCSLYRRGSSFSSTKGRFCGDSQPGNFFAALSPFWFCSPTETVMPESVWSAGRR